MATIALEGMEFFARHGVFEEESITGNTFIVDLYFETDTSVAESSDDISDTADYGYIYDAIKEEMGIPSRLLEHLARRILKRLQKDFPSVWSWDIRVAKLNPPFGGKVNAAVVIMSSD